MLFDWQAQVPHLDPRYDCYPRLIAALKPWRGWDEDDDTTTFAIEPERA